MAKFSMKVSGKEIGPASVYAAPHTMQGSARVKLGNGYDAEPTCADSVDMSVGCINRNGYNPAPKISGMKMRGTGAATKGVMSRGPMA